MQARGKRQEAAIGWSLSLTPSLSLFFPDAFPSPPRPPPSSRSLGSPPSSEDPTRLNNAQKQVAVKQVTGGMESRVHPRWQGEATALQRGSLSSKEQLLLFLLPLLGPPL